MIDRLSAREKEVARHLAAGISNKEIARGLGVEVVTVKKHVGNILRKLDARNRTHAAVVLAELERRGGRSVFGRNVTDGVFLRRVRRIEDLLHGINESRTG